MSKYTISHVQESKRGRIFSVWASLAALIAPFGFSFISVKPMHYQLEIFSRYLLMDPFYTLCETCKWNIRMLINVMVPIVNKLVSIRFSKPVQTSHYSFVLRFVSPGTTWLHICPAKWSVARLWPSNTVRNCRERTQKLPNQQRAVPEAARFCPESAPPRLAACVSRTRHWTPPVRRVSPRCQYWPARTNFPSPCWAQFTFLLLWIPAAWANWK